VGNFAFKWVPPSELDSLFNCVDLEFTPDQHFFLSSKWAQCYLPAWQKEERLGAVIVEGFNSNTNESSENAFAVLSTEIRRSKIGVSFLSIGFNVASSAQMKYVTPEINGLFKQSRVPSPSEFVEIVAGTVKILNGQGIVWGEIRLEAVPSDCAVALKSWARECDLDVHDVGLKKTYLINLAEIRGKGIRDFVDTRSSNSRSQLRKARRLIERSLGPLSLELAQTQEQVDSWFDALKELHRLRWRGTENGSGFDYQPFDQFHNTVAKGLLIENVMHLWRVCAGATNIGYLQVFSTGRRAYFNISGINYDVESKFKPGLLAHWMVIQYYLDEGYEVYDFMVGTSQYKQSLCTATGDLHFFSIRKSNLAFKLEGFLRRFKRALLCKTTVNTSS
jgi:Acetyltransferase (GNAT) domain